MDIKIGNDWDQILASYFNSNTFKQLNEKMDELYLKETIFPKQEDLFRAFKLTSFEDTKVVILGQDPYHDIGQATGLAFSVPEGCKLPPSLRNIFKEIENEFGYSMSNTGNLEKWAKQGVLLINNVLAVKAHQAGSLAHIGFENFTDYVFAKLNQKTDPVVFVFWGKTGLKKMELITSPNHYILESNHPSPLSAYRGFFGNGHFKKINELLKINYNYEIDWRL